PGSNEPVCGYSLATSKEHVIQEWSVVWPRGPQCRLHRGRRQTNFISADGTPSRVLQAHPLLLDAVCIVGRHVRKCPTEMSNLNAFLPSLPELLGQMRNAVVAQHPIALLNFSEHPGAATTDRRSAAMPPVWSPPVLQSPRCSRA